MSDIVSRLRVAANEPVWGERDERDRLMDEAADELERAHAECQEQARLLGMSGSVEAKLRAEIEHAQAQLRSIRTLALVWFRNGDSAVNIINAIFQHAADEAEPIPAPDETTKDAHCSHPDDWWTSNDRLTEKDS